MRARNALLPWAAFVLVHAVIIVLCLFGPGEPLGDVDIVYRHWATTAASGGPVPGIDVPFVYPVVALVPMLAALAIAAFLGGPAAYALGWLLLVSLVNAAAFGLLLGGRSPTRRRRAAAWWWLAFLLLQGPTALARIDAIAVALAIVGLLALSRHPAWGSVLMTLAAWVKVWPAAVVAAVVIAGRQRMRVAVAAAGTALLVVAVALALGSGWTVLSFVTEQTGRGIQIEAPVALPWLWQAALGAHTGRTIYYDHDILTFQVAGAGTGLVGALMTPLLAVVVAVILALGWRARRRGASVDVLLPPLVLALTVALIAVNKVGSPQFITWLAAPAVLGIVLSGRRWLLPAVLVLALAALTQVVYPYLYDWLLVANPAMVFVLTVRNALEFVVLGVALARLWTAARQHGSLDSARGPSLTATKE